MSRFKFTLKQSKWFCKLILFCNVLIDTDFFILLLLLFKIHFGNLHLEFCNLNLDFLFLYFEILLILFALLNLNFQFLKWGSCFKLNFFNLYQDWLDWFISLCDLFFIKNIMTFVQFLTHRTYGYVVGQTEHVQKLCRVDLTLTVIFIFFNFLLIAYF